jgi:hypothetical protein
LLGRSGGPSFVDQLSQYLGSTLSERHNFWEFHVD